MPLSTTVIARGSPRKIAAWSRASPTQRPVRLKPGSRATLATPLIDDGEDAEFPSVEHLIVDEVHAPVLARAGGGRHVTAL